MIVVSRYRVGAADARAFLADADTALSALAAQAGFVRGHVARAVDDPRLWLLSTEWEGVGAYRRALSSYDVKTLAVPLMYGALDEPSAFEVLVAAGTGPEGARTVAAPTRRAADADAVSLGEASGPDVPTDLG